MRTIPCVDAVLISSENPTMPMSEDEFNRLPSDVQHATRVAESQQRIAALAVEQRVKIRGVNGAIYAGLGSIVLTVFLTENLIFLLLLSVFSAGAGWLTVWLRCKLFGGMAIIGTTGVLVNAIGAGLGLCVPFFFIWIFYFALGGIVGAWADARRTMEDGGY